MSKREGTRVESALDCLRERCGVPDGEPIFSTLRRRFHDNITERKRNLVWERDAMGEFAPYGCHEFRIVNLGKGQALFFVWNEGLSRLLEADVNREWLRFYADHIVHRGGPFGGPEKAPELIVWPPAGAEHPLWYPLGGRYAFHILEAGRGYCGAIVDQMGHFWIAGDGTVDQLMGLAGRWCDHRKLKLPERLRGYPFVRVGLRGQPMPMIFCGEPGLVGWVEQPPYEAYLFARGPDDFALVRCRVRGLSPALVATGRLFDDILGTEAIFNVEPGPVDDATIDWSSKRAPTSWKVEPVQEALRGLPAIHPRIRAFLLWLVERACGRGGDTAREIIWRVAKLAEDSQVPLFVGPQAKVRTLLGMPERVTSGSYQQAATWLDKQDVRFYRHRGGHTWELEPRLLADPTDEYREHVEGLMSPTPAGSDVN